MLDHQVLCPADAGDAAICTCGALLRWALHEKRVRPWRPEPRQDWFSEEMLPEPASERISSAR